MTVHQALAIHFDSVAANTDEDREFAWPFPGKWRIDKVLVAPSTTAGADGTDYTTVTLETNDGAGGSYTTFGSLSTETVALTIGTSRERTMVATAAREVDQGDCLRVGKTDSGTGAVFDGGVTVLASRID